MKASITIDELRAHFSEQMETLKKESRDPDTMLERISARLRSGLPLYRFKTVNGKQVTERLY